MTLYCFIHGHTLKNYICQKCGANKTPNCAQSPYEKADPRCKGGNCTRHCELYCRNICLEAWKRKDHEWDDFVEAMK